VYVALGVASIVEPHGFSGSLPVMIFLCVVNSVSLFRRINMFCSVYSVSRDYEYNDIDIKLSICYVHVPDTHLVLSTSPETNASTVVNVHDGMFAKRVWLASWREKKYLRKTCLGY